ncbi:endonuclease V [Bremerella cremea]|uniref:endonuclease V n=1 Tax=Bremerella cremea TaxID=1031537 RepID=UPI0031EC2D00
MGLSDLRQVVEAFQLRIADLPELLTGLLQQVPAGKVTTYGDLAKALGDSVASRWVATWLLEADCPLGELSHRVVRSTGDIGLYFSGDVQQKIARLQAEGIEVTESKVNLKQHRFALTKGSMPLLELKGWQTNFVCRARPPVMLGDIRTIAGLDVSYAGNQGIAVCSRFDVDGKTLISHASICRPVSFPYITGYLAFRELPLHLELLATMQEEGTLPDLLLVDGNGRLHPRRLGIATMLGALAGIPTIGIAKKRICGTIANDLPEVGVWEPIAASQTEPNDLLGYAILPHAKTKHPQYVSLGYGVDDHLMKTMVTRCFAGHRSPEPIHAADRESRRIASTIIATGA